MSDTDGRAEWQRRVNEEMANCQPSPDQIRIARLAAENERLRAALMKAHKQMRWLAENERECLGVVPMDDGSEVPAIWIAVADIDAALGGE